MPIKFRCQSCKQFLGISRSKAGEVVDCPSCGRLIRVPNLDGTREPIPDPKWDHDDSSLANALDQLASLGSDEQFDSESESELVVPASPEPIALEVPVRIPEPVSIDPPLPATPVAASTGPVVIAEPDPLDTLSASAGNAGRSSERKRWPLLMLSLLLCSLSFVAGIALGPVLLTSDDVVVDSEEAPPLEQQQRQKPVATAEPQAALLSGQVTWRGANGSDAPDRGARVVVFPELNPSGSHIPVAGLGPGAEPIDFEIASEMLTRLGGAVAVADDEGRYELSLPDSGTFQVLFISRYQQRDSDERFLPAIDSLSEEWFYPASRFRQQVLRHVAHELSVIESKNREALDLDQAFGRDDASAD